MVGDEYWSPEELQRVFDGSRGGMVLSERKCRQGGVILKKLRGGGGGLKARKLADLDSDDRRVC